MAETRVRKRTWERPKPPVPTPAQMRKRFIDEVRTLHRHHKWEVFQDFCLMAMYSMQQAATGFIQDREDAYMRIVSRYHKDEVMTIAGLLGIVIEALEFCPEQDFLGSVFGELELSNHWRGQFFTPYHVSSMMAQMLVNDGMLDTIKEKGYVTMSEPACGAGCMIIAMADALKAKGVEVHKAMYVEAWDIDQTAAAMTYIQLTLLGGPAKVVCGNTLFMEYSSVSPTLAYVLNPCPAW